MKKNRLKDKNQDYDTFISIILIYFVIGFIIAWYNNCENFFYPVLYWPYFIIDYFLKKIESYIPAKYCY